MPTFEYKAIQVDQTESGNTLILFAAPATDIDRWAGVPQKKEIGTQETSGFQRELNEKRLKSLIEFYDNPHNIIQNPLLCAKRMTRNTNVTFTPSGEDIIGTIKVEFESFNDLKLLDMLLRVKEDLEGRLSDLSTREVSEELVYSLKKRLHDSEEHSHIAEGMDFEEREDNENNDEEQVYFSDESHLLDFWDELAARVIVLEEIKESTPDFDADVFLDFSKEAMLAFLKPIVLVDGQHRLKGALESADLQLNSTECQERIETAIDSGRDPQEVQKEIESDLVRLLPISLLLSDDPSEHVFQFIIVNQKATPIGRALLGTIVSTSLTNEELESVSDRLIDSGIKLEESRAAAAITRDPISPFFKLVERGYKTDKGLLPWTVLLSLISIFKDLKHGNLFHEDRTDYASNWRHRMLERSQIVESYEDEGHETKYKFWRSPNGPWRDVFLIFWTKIRDKFSDLEDPSTQNFWGNTGSQLYNKVSLTILAADFFQFMSASRGIPIDNANNIPELIDEWLDGVNDTYFSRPWNLPVGLKKDAPNTRKKWAQIWVGYRKNPSRLPNSDSYGQPYTG